MLSIINLKTIDLDLYKYTGMRYVVGMHSAALVLFAKLLRLKSKMDFANISYLNIFNKDEL